MAINLSKMQKEVVEYGDGALLVKAGPGSGKTRVLIERIKTKLITEKRVHILALTFSNMAAEEMKNRLEEDDEISEFVENVTIGTVHSFCMELIQKRYNLLGFTSEPTIFENDTDRKKILKDVFYSNEQWKACLLKDKEPSLKLERGLQYISKQKRNFIYPENYESNELFRDIYEEYTSVLHSQNAIDFDDILYYAYKIINENASVAKIYRKIYKYVFVDEAQDLNFAQYMIIKTLFPPEISPNIMLVGDENQSIYAFNGSNSNLMTDTYVNEYSANTIKLFENFRSARSIVRYANKLEKTDSETNYFYEGEMNFLSFENENFESEYVANDIRRLLTEGHKDIDHKLKYSNFAIIARNRYSLDQIAKTFDNLKMPYYFKKNTSGINLDSSLILAFDLSVRLMINSKDILHKNQLLSLVKKEKGNNFDDILKDTRMEILLDSLFKLKENGDVGKTLKLLENNINKSQFTEEETAEIIGDINLYRTHWNRYAMLVDRDVRSISSFRSYVSLGKTTVSNDESGIALLTVHMSKGLQYEVVYVIGAANGMFPDYRSLGNDAKLSQEKNNMFVAVTRAKRICNVSFSRSRLMPWGSNKTQSPSVFIKDQNIIDR